MVANVRARMSLDERTLRAINAACPGTRIEGADPDRMAPGTPRLGERDVVEIGPAPEPARTICR
jgi:hypothetical protein